MIGGGFKHCPKCQIYLCCSGRAKKTWQNYKNEKIKPLQRMQMIEQGKKCFS
jgi:hypothetical protein